MDKPWRKVYRGLMYNNPMLFRLKRMMYDNKTSSIIDKLKDMRIAGIHKQISKQLGLEPVQFKRLLKKFSDYKLEFTIHSLYTKIGLIEYLIFVKNKYIDYKELQESIRSWLKSYTKVFIPKGTLITMYLPYEYKNSILKEIGNWLEKLETDVISSNIFIHRLQPSFTKYEPSIHPLYKGYEIRELEEIFNNVSESKPSWFISEDELSKYIDRPHDIIDLLILKELESNAFIKVKTISEKHGFKMKTFRKHLVYHLIKQDVIRGIYLKSFIFIEAFGSPILLLLKTSDRSLYYKWINFFNSLENTLIIGYSPYFNENILYVILSKTYRYGENFKSFLISKVMSGYIEELIPLEYIVDSTVKYTIPYRNFDQDSKNWSIDIDSAHKKIMKRIFKM